MVSLCSRNAFLMNFLFYIFLLLHWWLLFYGRPLKKKSHIKTFSENATTLREAGYWFIPEALIRKTGSQHKVFPSLYSNEAEFALWCAALILETKEGEKMRFSDQIDLGNGALRNWQAESERLLFDHSTSTRRGRGSTERWSVALLRNPPTACWMALCRTDAPSSGSLWRPGSL